MAEALSAEQEKAIAAVVRKTLRDELAMIAPHLRAGPALISARDCAKRYCRGYYVIRRMIARGELKAVERPHGGVVHHLVVVADAERKLGGGT